MERFTHFIIIVLFLGALSTQAKSQIEDCLTQYSGYDTVSSNGNFIKYHLKYEYLTKYHIKNNYVSLEYGNRSFHRFLKEKFECQTADSRIPSLEWDNNDFICLRYGCGSPCWGVLILPLDSTDSARNIMYELAFNTPDNLIVYLDNDHYEKIVVENLKSKVKQVIEVPLKCDAAFLGACIDSISIKNKELYYRFAVPNNFDNNKKLTEFRIKIK